MNLERGIYDSSRHNNPDSGVAATRIKRDMNLSVGNLLHLGNYSYKDLIPVGVRCFIHPLAPTNPI